MREAHRQALICAGHLAKRMQDNITVTLSHAATAGYAAVTVTKRDVTITGVAKPLKGDGAALARYMQGKLDKANE